MARRGPGALPGFGLALGWTLTWLSLIVLVPLATLVWKSTDLGWGQFWALATSPRALASYRLTFGTALAAATVNLLLGTIVAWVLVRYRFWGRSVVDALVDIPFALPTAVSGLAITAALAPRGWIGGVLADHGVRAAEPGVRRRRGLGDRQVRVPRQERADHADRPAVLGVAGGRRPDLRAGVRRCRAGSASGCATTTSRSSSPCRASCWPRCS
jgi:hypothetical protein